MVQAISCPGYRDCDLHTARETDVVIKEVPDVLEAEAHRRCEFGGRGGGAELTRTTRLSLDRRAPRTSLDAAWTATWSSYPGLGSQLAHHLFGVLAR